MKNLFSGTGSSRCFGGVYCSDIYEAKMIIDIAG